MAICNMPELSGFLNVKELSNALLDLFVLLPCSLCLYSSTLTSNRELCGGDNITFQNGREATAIFVKNELLNLFALKQILLHL